MQGKSQLEARSAQQQVYVGIDACKEHLDAYLHPGGQRLRVANHRDGIGRLKRALKQHDIALVVIEATGKFHRLAQRSLADGGFAVAVVNPLRSRLFAEALGTHAKTDRVDARMLAVLGEALAPEARPPVPIAIEALQELVHAHGAAVANRTALHNRLAASQVAFLQSELKRQLANLERHISRLADEIAKRIAAEPTLARRYQILVSIPGFGPTVAAGLIADMPELGTLDRRAVASLAGLAPFADDSGGKTGQRHIKGGRPLPRRALYWAALSAARYNPDLRGFYSRLRDKGKKPKVALTAVMRKLVVLANSLLTRNNTWVDHSA